MMQNTTIDNSESVPFYYMTLQALIAFVAVIGNGVVIYFICTRRRLHVVSNYFILSLAVADFLVGLFLPTFFIICQFWSSCMMDIYNTFFNLFTFISIANLFVMTIDRYISIVHPLRYPSYATFRRILASILASWFIPACFVAWRPILLKYSSSNNVVEKAAKAHAFIVITVFEVVPTVVMPALYARIFCTARRHAREVSVQKTQLAFNGTLDDATGHGGNLELSQISKKRTKSQLSQRSKREPKSEGSNVAVLGAVIGLFVLCWSFDTVISFCLKLDLCEIGNSLFRVADLMIYLNSAVNPLVYAFLKKDIRKELSAACRCNRRSNESPE